MKITVIGVGYVGLPASVCFADLGNNVISVDKIEEKITRLKQGIVDLYEPELDELLKKQVKENRLEFTTDLTKSTKDSQVIFIAVGTPTDEKTGNANLTFLKDVANDIASNLTKEDGYKIIAIKSTVPIGSNDMIEKLIREKNPNIDFDIVSIPEFLREGKAVEDFMNPERIVIGINNDRVKDILNELYLPFSKKNIPILYCSRRSSEMIKYAANAFLGIKISYINQIADLCEEMNADIREVSYGIGLDSRIGNKFLNAGPGFGGSCFPKDMLEIMITAQNNDAPLSLVETAYSYNKTRVANLINKIEKKFAYNFNNKIVALLGLAFKGDTDDIRYSPAIEVAKMLIDKNAKLQIFDPKAMDNSKIAIGDNQNIKYVSNVLEAVDNADILIIATEWKEFGDLDLENIGKKMRGKIIIDFRNMLNAKKVKDFGYKYIPIGYSGI